MDRNELAARFAVADYGAKCRAYYAGGPKGPGPDVYSGTAEDAFKMADLFLDYAERIDARPVKSTHTPAPVPPPAPTPAPEVCCASPLCPHSSPGGGTSQVGGAAERDAGIVTPASSTPAPEAKRPTHVRITGPKGQLSVTIGKVYEVLYFDASRDRLIIKNDDGVEWGLSNKPDEGPAFPTWAPAPCPPPVAGSAEDVAVRDAEARVIAAAIAWNAKYNSDEVKYPEGAHSERLDLNDAVAALAEARAALSRPVRP